MIFPKDSGALCAPISPGFSPQIYCKKEYWRLVPAPAGTNVKALASPDAAPAKPAPPPATQTIDAQYQEVEDQSTATAASQ